MSGTSVDGVSLVLTDVEGAGKETQFKIHSFKTYRYPRWMKNEIFNLFDKSSSNVEKVCMMNFVLGMFYADKILNFIESSSMNTEDIDLIASHGQTIYHLPKKMGRGRYRTKSTLQIGEPSIIAEMTGIPTVADFRPRDIAAGGDGAPIIPYVDYVLFGSEKENIVVHNIGGIANLTYLPKGCTPDDIIAFDTGPGNMIIDYVVSVLTDGKRTYDKGGKLALAGKVNHKLLRKLISHPYIKRKPPKTTGREMFGANFCESLLQTAEKMGVHGKDLIATVTFFTVKSMAYAYRHFIGDIDLVVLGGGGAYNEAIRRWLSEEISVEVKTHEDFGIPNQAKEPLGIAILANETIMGNPNNIPKATGAEKYVVMGKILL